MQFWMEMQIGAAQDEKRKPSSDGKPKHKHGVIGGVALDDALEDAL